MHAMTLHRLTSGLQKKQEIRMVGSNGDLSKRGISKRGLSKRGLSMGGLSMRGLSNGAVSGPWKAALLQQEQKDQNCSQEETISTLQRLSRGMSGAWVTSLLQPGVYPAQVQHWA